MMVLENATMVVSNGKAHENCHDKTTSSPADLAVVNSPYKYIHPPEGTNVAREFIQAFRKHQDKTLLVDANTGREWTGVSLLEQSARIGTGLIKRAQVKPDSVVLMMCEHTGDEVLFGVGAILAGGALYSAGPDEPFEEQRTLCEIVRPDVVAASSRAHHLLVELKRRVVGMEQVKLVWIDDPTSPVKPGAGQRLSSDQGQQSYAQEDANESNNNNADVSHYMELIKKDDVILLSELLETEMDMGLIERVAHKQIVAKQHKVIYMLTSGSTGQPKVVPTSHDEFVNSIYSMYSATQSPEDGRAPLWPITPDSTLAGDLPLDHGAGVNTMFLSLFLGSKLIVMQSYNAESFWQAVSDYKITHSISSTTFAYHILNRLKRVIRDQEINGDQPQDVVGRSWKLSSLEFLACAGAKIAFLDTIQEVCKVYDHIRVCQAYGATEMGHMSTVHLSDCPKYIDSVGHLLPGMKSKVVNRETGQVACFNEMGELHMWARSKFSEYRSRLGGEADARMYADCHDSEGYYKTGDKAHFDPQGRLYIHGRYKDTLTLQGDWKILPVELEEVVNKHPLVAQSAVVGLPDPNFPGVDMPKAFVRLICPVEAEQLFSSFYLGHLDSTTLGVTGQQMDTLKLAYKNRDHQLISKSIYDFCAERTATQKHLIAGVRILEKFPTNGLLNKIDRKVLKTMD